jgi:hypothetical protein
MSKKPNLPVTLPSVVESVGRSVTPEDVDTYGRVTEINDQSHRVRTIVTAWKRQQEQDRNLRRHYATVLLIGLGVQVVFIDVVYMMVGFGKLTIEPWTTKTMIMAVFAEAAAMVFWIVKYLFRPINNDILDLQVTGSPSASTTSRGSERKEKNRQR